METPGTSGSVPLHVAASLAVAAAGFARVLWVQRRFYALNTAA